MTLDGDRTVSLSSQLYHEPTPKKRTERFTGSRAAVELPILAAQLSRPHSIRRITPLFVGMVYHGRCPPLKPWARNRDSSSVQSCHPTESPKEARTTVGRANTLADRHSSDEVKPRSVPTATHGTVGEGVHTRDGVVGGGFVAVAGGVVVVVVGASVVVVGVFVAGSGAGSGVVVCAAGGGAAGGVVVVVRRPPGESVVIVALPAPPETPVLSPLFSRAEMAAPCATCLARSTEANYKDDIGVRHACKRFAMHTAHREYIGKSYT